MNGRRRKEGHPLINMIEDHHAPKGVSLDLCFLELRLVGHLIWSAYHPFRDSLSVFRNSIHPSETVESHETRP